MLSSCGRLDQSHEVVHVGLELGGQVEGQVQPRRELGVLPHRVAAVAPISPGYWAVRGLHAARAGDIRTSVAACGTLLAVALACGALASVRLRGRGGRLVAL
ncbi:hypothetical protein ACFY05_05630 [Microtetraspora fusca]|uniref:Uncharacterized protein n=1 Tax=Microtetraspora fusca TaxID=1997 RepID=A0ABW6V133_MICFU